MDFFDPKKQKQHAIRLGVGYALIGLALVLATTILLYQAYGFGIDRSGNVIQNGLVFVSSQPAHADIYVSNQLYKSQTNTRLVLPAGQYTMRIGRAGYRNWQRAVTVEGSSVERFDYPFLFPSKLATTTAKKYADAPSLSTQSPDRHWALLSLGGASNDFDLYDLSVSKPTSRVVSIPVDILTASATTTSWQLVRWADDNRHVLLRREFQKDSNAGSEYILFDRQNPGQAQNLSQLLGFTPITIALRSGAYDQYLAFDQVNGTLFTATLKKSTPQLYLEHVLNFATDEGVVLYATAQDAPAGKVQIRLRRNDDPSYLVRNVSAGSTYLLNLASYKGTPYVAAGAQSEDKVYVYKDALANLQDSPKTPLVPVQILKVAAPTYTMFSENARFVMAENSDHFAVYDAENDKGYAYQVRTPLDAPQTHATWMDGYHLDLISDGKVRVFDFDGANAQALAPASPNYLPVFSRDYRILYTLTTQSALTSTPLRTPQDQ
jgi:hypothetical protein